MLTIEPYGGRDYAVFEVDRDAKPPVRELKKVFSTAEQAVAAYPKAQVKSVSTAQDHQNALKANAAEKQRRQEASQPKPDKPSE